MLKKPNPVAGVLKLVNVGPNFGLPGFIVSGGNAAGGAACVQADRGGFNCRGTWEFEEDAADLLNFLVFIQQVFIA